MTDDGKKKKKVKIPFPRRSKFRCRKCGKSFQTIEGLVRHDFKAHPTSS